MGLDDSRGRSAGLPSAKVETVSLAALDNNQVNEADKLFQACCTHGFFYLDFHSHSTAFETAVNDIYRLERELFDLPDAELMPFDIDVLSPRQKLNGDGFQSYALPKDNLRRIPSLNDFPRPRLVDKYLESLHSFTQSIAKASSSILSSLSDSLGLPPASNLTWLHNTHLPSLDLVRLLKYHAQPPTEEGSSLVPHTDLGSLTFLFTLQPGLQILNPQTKTWEAVTPPKHNTIAIVNIGDCMKMLTRGSFRSSKHRVIAAPRQGMSERYSFAYLLRPDEHAVLRAVESPSMPVAERMDPDEPVMTTGEWLQRKFQTLRRETWNEERDWILMGGA
ncbi:MAG: hypothetical protein Q9183_003399, partial [Haloplaca sp. 2 TL-2023]